MLKNPYQEKERSHFITSRVSSEDYNFVKNIFPMTVGLTDKLVSTLYKKFVDELRTLNSNTPGGLERAWFVECSTHAVVDLLLAEFQRQPTGQSVGHASPRDVGGGTGELRETVQRPPEQRTDEEGRVTKRRRSKKKSTSEK